MGNHMLRIAFVSQVTHNLLQIITEKPAGFDFLPGQSAHIAINKSGWLQEKSVRPYTFTQGANNNSLEFFIKTSPEQQSLLNELLALKQGDELILHDASGAIAYQGEGVFIAGGAGPVSLVSIFRNLKPTAKAATQRNLLCSKASKADLIF